ncbi:Hypp55 [Branchiostoma lanceolatum]|uniref:Hypp55 protein n=1 Tax=Branchiostoma lanceolatum TaxID=7740 RepID=A0A8J9VWU3_BRALA|nr:Hypp55 [Branchiostoma lanceolatum]
MSLLVGSTSLIAAAPTHEWWRVAGDDVDRLIARAEQSFGGEMLGREYRDMALRRAVQVAERMDGEDRVEALSKIFTRLASLQKDLYETERVCREGVQLMQEAGPTTKNRHLVEGMRTQLAVTWLNQDRARERRNLSPGTSHTHQAVRLLRDAACVLETSAKENLNRGTPSRKLLLQLANTLQSLGRQFQYDDAERSLQRALLIYRHIYGLAHHTTINVLDDMGCLYNRQGDYDRAISCYRRAAELGEAHAPWLVSAILRNLGSTLVAMNDKSGARDTFVMALHAALHWQRLLVSENNDLEPNATEENYCRNLLDSVKK